MAAVEGVGIRIFGVWPKKVGDHCSNAGLCHPPAFITSAARASLSMRRRRMQRGRILSPQA